MPITKQQVEHIAQLVRLGLMKKDVIKFQKELDGILQFVERLDEVKTDNIEPIGSVMGLINSTRKDEAVPPCETETKKLLEAVPSKKDRNIKVRKVL